MFEHWYSLYFCHWTKQIALPIIYLKVFTMLAGIPRIYKGQLLFKMVAVSMTSLPKSLEEVYFYITKLCVYCHKTNLIHFEDSNFQGHRTIFKQSWLDVCCYIYEVLQSEVALYTLYFGENGSKILSFQRDSNSQEQFITFFIISSMH